MKFTPTINYYERGSNRLTVETLGRYENVYDACAERMRYEKEEVRAKGNVMPGEKKGV